jgi:hypothetical protein
MPDDEPLDDARQVAMATAAAAARVVETIAREARDQAAQHRAALERVQDQQRARETLDRLGSRYEDPAAQQQREERQQRRAVELAQAEAWASPERLEAYHFDQEGCDSSAGKQGVRDGLIRDWKAATGPYDSPDRREAADAVREAVGVSAEARQTRAASDLMNSTQPGRPVSSLEDPDSWYRTGGEPATERQVFTLEKLGLDPSGLSKADASKVIAAPEEQRSEVLHAQRARATSAPMNGASPARAAGAQPATSATANRTAPRIVRTDQVTRGR